MLGLLKKAVQSRPEPVEGKAAGDLAPAAYMEYVRANGAKSAKSVSAKLGKMATCLREAAPAGVEPLACQP